MAALQDRLRIVEAAWAQFVPDIELSTAVLAVEQQMSTGSDPASLASRNPSSLPDRPSTKDISPSPWATGPRDAANDPFQDSDYEDANSLDWDESVDVAAAADGIGSLSMNPKGIGYMGPQSGNALLRKLQSISVLYFTPCDELTLQQSPQPGVPEHILRSPQFVNQCIDWYFQYYHCAYPILHEGHFRAQLMGNDHSSPCLLPIG